MESEITRLKSFETSLASIGRELAEVNTDQLFDLSQSVATQHTALIREPDRKKQQLLKAILILARTAPGLLNSRIVAGPYTILKSFTRFHVRDQAGRDVGSFDQDSFVTAPAFWFFCESALDAAKKHLHDSHESMRVQPTQLKKLVSQVEELLAEPSLD